MARKLALITGASSGIGAGFAECYAQLGHDLVLVARRKDRLESLAEELRAAHQIECLVIQADLADPAAPDAIVKACADAGRNVDILINNAGYGDHGFFGHTPWKRYETYLQVMLTAPVKLCHLLIPGMTERGYGRIINVSSMAAFAHGIAAMSFYGSSKSFLVKFTETLNAELQGTGVHLTALCPGATRTDFFQTTCDDHVKQMDSLPKFMWLSPTQVARIGFAGVEANRPVVISGWVNRLIEKFLRILPNRIAWSACNRQAASERRKAGMS